MYDLRLHLMALITCDVTHLDVVDRMNVFHGVLHNLSYLFESLV